MAILSIENENNNCLFFYYFLIGCYIICVIFLIYTLIRLLKYYLSQRRINQQLSTTMTTTTVLLKIQNINEYDTGMIRGEMDIFQPLIIKTQELPAGFMENHPNEPPPDYREHL